MRVGDVMARGAVTIFSDATVEEAAELMLRHQVRGLAVLNRSGFLVGVLTERDLLRRVELGTGRHCPRWLEFWLSANQLAKEFVQTHGRKIHEVMTSNPIVLGPETPLREADDLMEQHGIKQLPV